MSTYNYNVSTVSYSKFSSLQLYSLVSLRPSLRRRVEDMADQWIGPQNCLDYQVLEVFEEGPRNQRNGGVQ